MIKDRGGIRHQFHHVIDVVPTILEATRIPAPVTVDGIKQAPIEGVSLAYTFDQANAKAPSQHKTQYFEMMGDRAIYHDGWIASTKVMRAPWDITGAAEAWNPTEYPWELYDLRNDWTQSEDVAAKYPAKLKEMQALFWKEAKKYQVLPLDNSLCDPGHYAAAEHHGRPQCLHLDPAAHRHAQRRRAEHPQRARTTSRPRSRFPQGGAEGMLITQGGRFGGYGFYLLKGKPVFLWNLVDLKRIRWEGPEALTPGKHTLEFDFKYDGLGAGTLAFNNYSGIGQGGTGVLKVDGKEVATQKMEHTIPFILQWDESLDIGSDTLTGVNDADYQPPFKFTGKLNKADAHHRPAEAVARGHQETRSGAAE